MAAIENSLSANREQTASDRDKLLWAADIKLYIGFHMATLNLPIANISRFEGPKCAKDGSYCPCIVQLDVHVLSSVCPWVVKVMFVYCATLCYVLCDHVIIVQHISRSNNAFSLKSHNAWTLVTEYMDTKGYICNAVRCGCGPLHCGVVRSRAKLLGLRRVRICMDTCHNAVTN